METVSASDLAARPPSTVRDTRVEGRLGLEGRALTEPLVFEDCEFDEDVCLDEATTSSVRFVRCKLPAISARNVETRGDLVIEDVGARRIVLAGAHVGGSLRLDGTRLSGGPALDVSNVRVDEDMLLTSGFAALGDVIATGARIEGNVDFAGATLDSLGTYALFAEGVRVGGNLTMEMTAHGIVLLTSASVEGTVDLTGARLCHETYALFAESLRVGRNLFLAHPFRAHGEVRLVGAVIGGALNLEGATLSAPNLWALNAWGIEVGMGLWGSGGLSVDGDLRLTNARVRGPLDLMGTSLAGSGSIDLVGADTDELQLPGITMPPGLVDLRGARTRVFGDNWRMDVTRYKVAIGDFAYETLDAYDGDVESRLDWVARSEGGFVPGTYDRLATVLRAAGHEDDARAVAIARERARGATLHPAGRWASRFLAATVGYGYRPWRAAGWLAAVVLAGWWLFGSLWRDDVTPVESGPAQPGFNALLFSLDAVLPVVDLGQDGHWTLAGPAQWWFAFSVLTGWVLATVLVAALTARLVRD